MNGRCGYMDCCDSHEWPRQTPFRNLNMYTICKQFTLGPVVRSNIYLVVRYAFHRLSDCVCKIICFKVQPCLEAKAPSVAAVLIVDAGLQGYCPLVYIKPVRQKEEPKVPSTSLLDGSTLREAGSESSNLAVLSVRCQFQDIFEKKWVSAEPTVKRRANSAAADDSLISLWKSKQGEGR